MRLFLYLIATPVLTALFSVPSFEPTVDPTELGVEDLWQLDADSPLVVEEGEDGRRIARFLLECGLPRAVAVSGGRLANLPPLAKLQELEQVAVTMGRLYDSAKVVATDKTLTVVDRDGRLLSHFHQ